LKTSVTMKPVASGTRCPARRARKMLAENSASAAPASA
jgi:hypothetical protein